MFYLILFTGLQATAVMQEVMQEAQHDAALLGAAPHIGLVAVQGAAGTRTSTWDLGMAGRLRPLSFLGMDVGYRWQRLGSGTAQARLTQDVHRLYAGPQLHYSHGLVHIAATAAVSTYWENMQLQGQHQRASNGREGGVGALLELFMALRVIHTTYAGLYITGMQRRELWDLAAGLRVDWGI